MESVVAEVAISALLESVVKLLPKVSRSLPKFGKENKIGAAEIRKLYQLFGDLRAVLQDAEEKQAGNSSIRHWLTDLADLAYDVEDMLEQLEYESSQASKLQVGSSRWVRLKTKFFQSHSKWADVLKEIMERLQEMQKRKEQFNLFMGNRSAPKCSPIRSLDGSISVEHAMYGRGKEKDEIIDFLLRPNNGSERIGIIPIVGMGGIGKTTLAQHAFNEDRVVSCFEVRIWVCISLEFDKCSIYKRIVEVLTSQTFHVQDECSLEEKVQRVLKDKKFLIILDDLWHEDIIELNRLLGPFHFGAPNSKVIITTRNAGIAYRMKNEKECIELRGISDENCWSLFCSHARLTTKSNLVAIGKEISKRCAGNPLAVVIMGGLLKGNENEESWKAVLNNSSLISETGQYKIILVLKMSYDTLPDCLKLCFLCCTMFPEDYQFEKEYLVQIWMSSGLVKVDGQSRNWEDMKSLAASYFDELVARSLLSKHNYYGYVMHDLIRDMGKKISSNIYCRWENRIESLEKKRHLSINKSLIAEIDDRLKDEILLPLRSFLAIGGQYKNLIENGMNNLFLKARKLRVLSIEGCGISKIPEYVGQMIHLRYMDISGCYLLYELPSELGQLINLQYLNMSGCIELTALPTKIGNLINLKALNMTACGKLKTLPREIGNLINLQYLHLQNCRKLTTLPSEIGNLACLQYLNMNGCELTALPSKIGNLINLQNLYMSYCKLMVLPSEICKLVNLRCLKIVRCDGLTALPSEIGGLINLEVLTISYCRRIAMLPSEIGNLTNLQFLDLRYCPELTRLPPEISNLINLQCLEIDDSIKLRTLPPKVIYSIKQRNVDFSCKDYCVRD